MLKKKKKKKNQIKYLIFALIIIAVIAAAVIAAIIRKTTSESGFSQMNSASFPLVTLVYGDGYSTELHGYAEKMDAETMRDVIVPLDENKSVRIVTDPFGDTLTSVDYEVRSLDTEDYIDGGSITEFEADGSAFGFNLKVSDLIESGTEYQLILKVNQAARTTWFYTRILYGKTMYPNELLAFSQEFSEANFDREKAASFIVNYIQPEDSSETDDFYYTDIHSKYSMFTFGNLEVTRGDDEKIRITELEPTQMSVEFSYTMSMCIDNEWREYFVDEFFCVRIRSEKVYLLDYHRSIEAVFDLNQATAETGRIQLGIGSGTNEVLSSDSGTYTAFVADRELWCCSTESNAVNMIFSFSDSEDASDRSDYDHHDIQIVNVSDDGSIDYMVYGYMNRGSYEGRVGICFYRYNAGTNSTKCLFFMPVTQSEQMLMMDLGTLAYVNKDDVCYLRYGDGIYSIDLNSGETVEVTISAYPGTYAFNKGGNVVAWQEGDDLNYPSRLVILNMDAQTTSVVNAPENEFVKILDFMGNDIVYGFGSPDDSIFEANIDTTQLLNKVIIASTDEDLAVQDEYDADGFYIVSAKVDDTRLVISRGVKNENGTLRSIDDEVLLLTQTLTDSTGRTMIRSRTSELQKKEYYIQINGLGVSDSQLSTTIPRFENADSINELNITRHQNSGYYVYGYGKLMAVESEINVAIGEAYDVFGVVVDENMNYIWTRGTRDLSHTIAIQQYTASDEEDSLAASLRILCAQEGIQLTGVNEELDSGWNPLEIINNALGEERALDLYGCTLSEVLYFVNQGHPVLAVMGDRNAVIIIGYDLNNVTVYAPVSGETATVTMETAASYFENNNNSFISCR